MNIIKYIRYLLFPFAIIYGLVTYIRNLFFNYGIGSFKSRSFATPIISLGNITVGGTGKTPHTEWIIRLLQNDYKVAVLSRGYKRETKGLVIATEHSSATDIGDEPMQMHKKYPKVQVVVAEERVKGIEAIDALKPKPQVILMDDAYQHRYVKPGLSILIMDYNRPFWKDCLLPAGELREFSSGKKRAQIIIVSKCPEDLSQQQRELYTRKFALHANQSVFFSSIGYNKLQPVFATSNKEMQLLNKKVLLVSGIAQPKPLFNYISQYASKTELMQFGDHHNFSSADIANITNKLKALGDDAIIVTTEKDAVRFTNLLEPNLYLAQNMYSLPIEIRILYNQQLQLQKKLFSYVRAD